jgi:hypothetical protein
MDTVSCWLDVTDNMKGINKLMIETFPYNNFVGF